MPNIPIPPALHTARARGAVAMNAMPALMNGTFSPYCSVMRVFNMKVLPCCALFELIALHRFRDRLRITEVVLGTLSKMAWHRPVVPASRHDRVYQLGSYIVRRHAGFDANLARRHIRKPRHNPAASVVIAYRRDRQLVLVLLKQFVAKRDEFVVDRLARLIAP
jgi:hypothetical protein